MALSESGGPLARTSMANHTLWQYDQLKTTQQYA